MCAILKVGDLTVQPGAGIFSFSQRGTDHLIWGHSGLYNARIENINKFWRNFQKSYIIVDGFYEGMKEFILPGYKMNLASVDDGVNLFVVTRPAIELVKPFHHRMPIVLADPEAFILYGRVVEIDYSSLKRA